MLGSVGFRHLGIELNGILDSGDVREIILSDPD
jgi:hypothetical protein